MQFEASESRGTLSDTRKNYTLQYSIVHTSFPGEMFFDLLQKFTLEWDKLGY